MDYRGIVKLALFFTFYFISCDFSKKQDEKCLMLNDSRVIDDLKFNLFTKIYHESNTNEYNYIFFKVYIRIFNVRKNKSFLFSSKDVDDYDEKYKYLSFNANKDFLLKIDTADILPIGYTFLPSNEVSNYDELIYSFRLEKKRISDISCNKLNIQYWYIDHIAGIGNVCFRPK